MTDLMKRTSRIIVLAGMAVASMAFVRQEGNLLRLTLKENTTDIYKIETKAKQTVNSPAGEQEIGINAASTYKVTIKKLDTDKGTADLSIENTTDKFDVDGPLAEMIPKPKPSTLTGKLSSRGRFDPDLGKVSTEQLMGGGGQLGGPSPVFVELPEKAVKIGDTWDVVISKGPFTTSEDQKLTAKLVGEKKLNDKDVWIISTSGSLKSDIDSSKLPKKADDDAGGLSGQDVKIKGTTEITLESLVEKTTGRTLRSEMKTKTKNTIEIVQMGVTVDSSGSSTTIATLQG